MAFAEEADAPVHVVHLSSAGALEAVRAAKARGVRASAETCPHYLALTDARYLDPDDAEVAKVVISPPLRSAADRDAMWAGLADGTLDMVATDHVPDRVAVEKRVSWRALRPDQQRRPGDRDAPGGRLVGGRGDRPDHAPSGWSSCWRRRRPACSASVRKASWSLAATRTWSCSIPPRGARSAPPTCTTLRTTPRSRGWRFAGRSAPSSSGAGPSSATACSSASAATAGSSERRAERD